MLKRQLTPTERALLDKIATSSQGVLTPARPRVVVGDEVDEHGRVERTTVALGEVLPLA